MASDMVLREKKRKDYKLMNQGEKIMVEVSTLFSELDKEKVKLEKRCRDLFEQLAKENEHAVIISEQNLDIFTLQQHNSYLVERISKLEEQLPKYKDDEDFDQLAPKTQARTLKKLETDAQRALWFGKRKEILKEICEANINSRTSLDFGEMNEHDLRAFLKDHGINTKIRNREKLMNLVSSNCLDI
ncbi:unnamed protein product [Mytilus coruscus]|uniref:Uncharacterized protein n=1 Tax=Mytilus coruscus TaxID=42192 RepID=A0A6J8BCL6_MYTCO|nr:unnamed protein product [Mytilus coruscus]